MAWSFGRCPMPLLVARCDTVESARPANLRDPLLHRRPLLKSTRSTLLPAIVLAAIAWVLATAPVGHAAVAVISNRTSATVPFWVVHGGGAPREFRLAGGDNLTLPLASSGRLILHSGKQEHAYTLSPDTAYVLFNRQGNVALTSIGLHEGLASPPLALPAVDWNAAPNEEMDASMALAPIVVPVKILVDEDERAARGVWEKRLRARIAEASAILERDCGIKLQVVDSGTWESDDKINDFPKSLAEFERKVAIGNERLAIGFTSQYTLVRGSTHLGGIRGPLAGHLLIREWSQVMTAPERLEVLLHELGHFFGAAHSPEPDSVMRPQLADRKSRAARFRIGFDPLNTLVVTQLADQLRSSGQRRGLGELALPVQLELRPIYAELDRAIPDDPNPRRYVGMIDQAGVERTSLATAAVIAAIQANAGQNSAVPPSDGKPGDGKPSEGKPVDKLASTAWRLRTAAKLSQELPRDLQNVSCLLAVGLMGPYRELLASHPLTRPISARILAARTTAQPAGKDGAQPAGKDNAQPAAGDTAQPAEKAPAQPAAGLLVTAAVRGDQPRLERLIAFAALASLIGSQRAEDAALFEAGINNPAATTVDFESYADACAGFCLSARLTPGRWHVPLARLAAEKDFARYLPPLPEELESGSGTQSRKDVERQYGAPTDSRFLTIRTKLCDQISIMPAFR